MALLYDQATAGSRVGIGGTVASRPVAVTMGATELSRARAVPTAVDHARDAATGPDSVDGKPPAPSHAGEEDAEVRSNLSARRYRVLRPARRSMSTTASTSAGENRTRANKTKDTGAAATMARLPSPTMASASAARGDGLWGPAAVVPAGCPLAASPPAVSLDGRDTTSRTTTPVYVVMLKLLGERCACVGHGIVRDGDATTCGQVLTSVAARMRVRRAGSTGVGANEVADRRLATMASNHASASMWTWLAVPRHAVAVTVRRAERRTFSRSGRMAATEIPRQQWSDAGYCGGADGVASDARWRLIGHWHGLSHRGQGGERSHPVQRPSHIVIAATG